MKINDIDIKDYGYKYLKDSKRSISPPTNAITTKIPGLIGSILLGTETDSIAYEITLLIDTNSRTELKASLRELSTILFNSKGQPKELKVSYDDEPDKWENVYYIGQTDLEKLHNKGKITIPFVNFKAASYSNFNEYNEVFNYGNFSYDTGLIYPNEDTLNWVYNKHRMGLYNYSHYETPIALSITGYVKNPRIELEGTEEYMQFNIDLNGRTLNINDDYTIDIDGENGFPYLVGGDFFMLQSGKNGLIFKGVSPNANVEMKWKHRFL